MSQQAHLFSTRPNADSPSLDAGTVTYDQACQKLQSARASLSSTVQEYLSACELMETITSRPSAEREKALLAIDAELLSIRLEEARIKRAHEILTYTRNRSKMVSPIYSLPPEILARVFTWATCNCTELAAYSNAPPILTPLALSAVCKQWRKVAIHHRALWAHIDIELSPARVFSQYPPCEVWAERSCGKPLVINVRQHGFGGSDSDSDGDTPTGHDDDEYSRMVAFWLLKFLLPLMHQVYSLTMMLSSPAPHLVKKLLESLTNARARLLTIDFNPEHGLYYIPLFLDATPLRDLEVLHLHNTAPPWHMWSLGNLTDLRLESHLEDSDWSMAKFELAAVLASSPRLQHLALVGLRIEDSPGVLTGLVALNRLQVLKIGYMTSNVLVSLLDMINPGGNALLLEIFPSSVGADLHAGLTSIRLFIDRSNVSVLQLTSGNEPCFASQLGPFPRVQTLVLDSYYISGIAKKRQFGTGIKTYMNPCQANSSTTLWPDLRHLSLNYCVLEKDYLYNLVSLHSIQTLRLKSCYHGQEASPSSRIDSETSKEYVQLLSEVVPKVGYY
ncbi:hypothetical protein FRC08_006468 [Ceratobasidium sp. 394]|nr:hypothetical protein FRC08_006468 [Ceratobasidium sp. 394]